MTSTIFQNLLLLAALAALALGIVWGFFRIFSPSRRGGDTPKWRAPAAAAGFFAVYTALIGLYVPLINRRQSEVLIQDTRYGPVELDVNRLFEISDSNKRIGVPRNYYVAGDTSFYFQPPDPTFWLAETDSLPTFREAVALQRHDFDLQFGDFANDLLGMPSLEDHRIQRYCAAEANNRQLIYSLDSRIGQLPVTFDPMRRREYWRAAIHRMLAAVRERLPDSLKAALAAEQVTEADVDALLEQWKATFGANAPPLPRQYLFRNSICIFSFPPETLEPELGKILNLPEQPLHLMRFAKRLQDVVSSFDLGTLRDISTSSDGRALLAREPIELRSVTFEGTKHERLAIEQIYLLAVSSERAYFVQVQFMVAPGQDMSSWRQVQQSLRSLRFVAHD